MDLKLKISLSKSMNHLKPCLDIASLAHMIYRIKDSASETVDKFLPSPINPRHPQCRFSVQPNTPEPTFESEAGILSVE